MKFNKGSTLIETILYGFLLFSFLIIVAQLIASVLDLQKESASTSLSSQDAMFIIKKLTNEIYQADNIQIPANPGYIASLITLQQAGQTHDFFLSGSNLFYNNGIVSGKLNGYGTALNSFTVRRIGNITGKPAVKIEFELQSLILEAGEARTANYALTASLR